MHGPQAFLSTHSTAADTQTRNHTLNAKFGSVRGRACIDGTRIDFPLVSRDLDNNQFSEWTLSAFLAARTGPDCNRVIQAAFKIGERYDACGRPSSRD